MLGAGIVLVLSESRIPFCRINMTMIEPPRALYIDPQLLFPLTLIIRLTARTTAAEVRTGGCSGVVPAVSLGTGVVAICKAEIRIRDEGPEIGDVDHFSSLSGVWGPQRLVTLPA